MSIKSRLLQILATPPAGRAKPGRSKAKAALASLANRVTKGTAHGRR